MSTVWLTMKYCFYYQAQVERSKAWLLVGIMRSYEHLVFDRTLNKEESIFEFFVAPDLHTYFLEVMKYFQECGIVSNFREYPNRLIDQNQV